MGQILNLSKTHIYLLKFDTITIEISTVVIKKLLIISNTLEKNTTISNENSKEK